MAVARRFGEFASRTADDTLESEARRICEQQLVDNADLLVVNTEQEARDLAEHYDAERDIIRVVSPGADVELFTPGTDRNTERSRRELGIPLHTKVVAFVGRLQKFTATSARREVILVSLYQSVLHVLR